MRAVFEVMGVTNAVTIDADAVGELTLIGPGAGGEACHRGTFPAGDDEAVHGVQIVSGADQDDPRSKPFQNRNVLGNRTLEREDTDVWSGGQRVHQPRSARRRTRAPLRSVVGTRVVMAIPFGERLPFSRSPV